MNHTSPLASLGQRSDVDVAAAALYMATSSESMSEPMFQSDALGEKKRNQSPSTCAYTGRPPRVTPSTIWYSPIELG